MNILFVTNNYTPYSGGVVSSIKATVKALQEKGHHVTVVTLDFLGNAHDDPAWVKRIPSHMRFQYKKNHMAVPRGARHYLKKIITKINPAVIHVHHPFLLGPIAVKIAKKMGIKTVFTYHTLYEEYAHYVPFPQTITKPLITKLVLSFCKKVDHLIVPSTDLENYLQNKRMRHVVVMPSGLKDQFIAQPFRKKELKKPYQLLYVGRFALEKNVTVLLETMKQLPDEYLLTLVGYGDYYDTLKQYAYEKLALSKARVCFIVKPSQEKLVSLYQIAHFFLFPSHTDTQGLVLAEAMACSTPVIALDGPGQRDIIQHAVNGFITDLANLQKTIYAAFSDQKHYEYLQKNAWHTGQSYDPMKLVNQLEQVYQK